LAEARRLFPTNPGAAVEHAWIAHFRNDWATAAERWERARETCPDYTSPFVFGGAALRHLGRYDDADDVLSEARRRFPDDGAAAFEFCSVAQARRDWVETLSRSEYAMARFPDHPQPLALGGLALREMGRLDEAEALLHSARERFPDDLPAAIEYARIADARSDRAEAHRRWTEARAVGPNHEAGFIGGAIALRADGRDDEAEVLLRQAIILAPTAIHPRIELVRIAEARGNWDEAEAGWHDITTRFPLAAHGPVGLSAIQRRQGRLDEAEAVITAALSRLPDDERLIEQGSVNAIAREDWPLALNRLYAGQSRFPGSHAIRQRLYEVQMRVAGPAGAPAEAPDILGGASDEARKLVMNFESLGGGGHGCEFGIFQRSVGAEPLGLLRWADIFQEQLTTALQTEFAGVGEPEFTRIFVPPTEDRGQYWTTDTRYHMAMGSFVYADQVPMDRMSKLIHQRMRFLRAKLIDDLHTGAKIFVYKNMKKTLTDAELTRLHAAVRRYADTTLFYIRYEDAEHPNGMVEWSGPGLLIGYIDHFSHTPDTDVLIGRADGQFLTLCRNAYALWTDRVPQ
jgi:tetratricopeptide (TPR) repeat protein